MLTQTVELVEVALEGVVAVVAARDVVVLNAEASPRLRKSLMPSWKDT
jgi:hypothetical protein